MNIKSVIESDDKIDESFDDLQLDMAAALEEGLLSDDPAPVKAERAPEENIAADSDGLPSQNELVAVEAPLEFQAAADAPEVAQKLTPHTQSRLSALNSFDKLYHDAQEHLQDIEAKLTEVTTSHHLTRQFFNILNADIHRANELELANINLTTEQKKLSEQLSEVSRRHQEREAVIEAMHQREASLAHDKDGLRADLAAARLELVEAVNTVARNDAELGDLVQKLSARTVEAERRSRENEVLREKQVNLSVDLDKALKREAEGVRKIEELSAIHANEVARHTELLASLGKSEKEVHRLQVVLETAQTKQAEMADEARIMDADRQAEGARNLAEMRGLRAEVQSLQERLDLATNEKSEATGAIARLKAELSDSQSEKAVADEKLSVLTAENESYKTSLSTVTANYSQLSLEHASEQMQLDVNRQECEDLREEIAALNARIKELLPHERMYRVAKAKLRDAGAAMVEVTNGATEEVRRAPARRASPQARSVNGARR
jgi:chromosome segregation ATPase